MTDLHTLTDAELMERIRAALAQIAANQQQAAEAALRAST